MKKLKRSMMKRETREVLAELEWRQKATEYGQELVRMLELDESSRPAWVAERPAQHEDDQ